MSRDEHAEVYRPKFASQFSKIGIDAIERAHDELAARAKRPPVQAMALFIGGGADGQFMSVDVRGPWVDVVVDNAPVATIAGVCPVGIRDFAYTREAYKLERLIGDTYLAIADNLTVADALLLLAKHYRPSEEPNWGSRTKLQDEREQQALSLLEEMAG